MPAWLFGLAITVLVGSAATAYLWLIRRRDDETAAGLLALAGMRWRDFSRLVLEAMQQRGLDKVTADREDPQEQSASFMLAGGEERWLLACKHGSAYRIGSAAVDELAAEVRLLGANGGILVTQGLLDKSGREKADKHGIEVLDGDRLWPMVKPQVEPALRSRLVGTARARAYRHIGIAWLGAITLGAACVLVLSGEYLSRSSPNAEIAQHTVTAAPPTTASKPVPAHATAAVTATASSEVGQAPTAEELAQQRLAVAKAVGLAAGLSHGVWITQSTLSVDRNIPEAQAWALVCREVERYPYLRTARVQLNPPPGSGEAVRWRQCKTM